MGIPVPVYDQRTQKGSDGHSPEDGNEDCVPTSLAAMVTALTGKPVMGDDLHDAVYGQGYVGMQDPARFVGLLRDRYGVQMARIEGTPAVLVSRAVREIHAGHPVLLAIPSDWDRNPPQSGYAHMVAGCDAAADGSTLTAMNPWGVAADGYSHAAYQTQSAAWWTERLAHCSYAGIWVLAKAGEGSMGVPTGWHDDGTTLVAPNGMPTSGWIRQHVIDAVPQWPADLMPVADLYGITDGWQQEFAASRSVVCTKAGVVTEKAGPDYLAQIKTLQQQLAAALAQVEQGKPTAKEVAAQNIMDAITAYSKLP